MQVAAIIGCYLLIKAAGFENSDFDKAHPAPLSTTDRTYANSRMILDFEFTLFATIAGIAGTGIFTAWQHRSPHARAQILETMLEPMSTRETYLLSTLE
jgi:hypothetical protein